MLCTLSPVKAEGLLFSAINVNVEIEFVSYEESRRVVTFKQGCYFPVDSDMTFHKGTTCFKLIPEKRSQKQWNGGGRGSHITPYQKEIRNYKKGVKNSFE